jgi:MaoC dehydratase-like protein
MGRQAAIVLYVLALVAVVAGVDVLFFRNRFWERLGERRNGLGVRRVLSEVPEALMSGDATCHFLHPISDRYFEDYVEGDVHRFGTIAVEADEIVAFAKQFDPQIIHTDPEAAKSGPFGGLIASGWHTAAS